MLKLLFSYFFVTVSSACNLFAYANSRLISRSKKVFNQANDELLVEKIKQLVVVIDFSQVSFKHFLCSQNRITSILCFLL